MTLNDNNDNKCIDSRYEFSVGIILCNFHIIISITDLCRKFLVCLYTNLNVFCCYCSMRIFGKWHLTNMCFFWSSLDFCIALTNLHSSIVYCVLLFFSFVLHILIHQNYKNSLNCKWRSAKVISATKLENDRNQLWQ